MLKTYVFPGQGSQNKGMGGDLFDFYEDWVGSASEILGYSIKELCLEDPHTYLNQTQYTQPALYVVNALSYRKLTDDTGRYPDYLAGHSLGEYNALLASGAINFETGLHIVKKRGELMSKISGGGMAAIVGAGKEVIEGLLNRNNITSIDIANYNTPSQFVISGLIKDIENVSEIFKNEGVMYIPLNVSAAFHSRYMEKMKNEFEEYLHDFNFLEIKIPVISNVTARPYQQADIKKNIVNQITGSVQWTESIRYLLGLFGADGMEFEEVGPGRVLAGLIKKIRKESEVPA